MIRVDFIFLILLWLVCSCHRSVSPVDSRLEQAEALMAACPDSSMAILDSIHQKQLTSSHQHALYALLYSEAGDKTSRSFTSDSLISIATDYFDHTNDHCRRGRAWYYRGIVYYELDSLAAALHCFEKAIEGGEKSQNNRLLMLCHARRRDIYNSQDIITEAIKEAKLALNYGIEAKDSANLPYLYKGVALSFDSNQSDSMVVWCQKGIDIAQKVNHVEALSSIYSMMSAIHANKNEYNKTIKFARLSIQQTQVPDPFALYSIGYAHLKLHEYDSVRIYLDSAQHNAYPAIREAILKCLSELEQARGNIKKALEYKNQYEQLADSMRADSVKNEVVRSTIEIAQQRMDRTHRKQLVQRRRIFFVTFMVLMCIASWGWRRYFRSRTKLATHTRLFSETQHQLHLLTHALESKDKALADLQSTLSHEQSHREGLEKQISEIEIQRERLSVIITKTESQMEQFKNSSFYVWLVQRLDNGTTSISKDELHDLRQALNLYFDNFTHRLSAQFPQLTPDEVNLCCLEKIGIPTKMIANIVHMTPNAVSRKKQQILSRKLQADQTVDKLSEFLSIY